MKRLNLNGQTFGMLTVLELSEKIDASGARMWKCRCKCGNITYSSSNKLISGGKKSCGCANPYKPKSRPKPEYAPFTDCRSYRADYARGCTALIERLCETRGKCGFYKSKGEA